MTSSHQPRTYYTLLDIPQDASPKEIEKAYKRQALIHHPDRNPNDSQTQSTNKFQKLAEAYEVLRDPAKRRKYDLKVASTIALHSSATDYPPRPASQQSNTRPANHQPKRSSTFDLFAYPGEAPRHVPPPSRRPPSVVPPGPPRSAAPSVHDPMSSSSSAKNPALRQPLRHTSAHHHQPATPTPHQHKPFTQKINLKDLDSLDFILTMGLHPQTQPPSRPNNNSNNNNNNNNNNNKNIPSSSRAQARPAPQGPTCSTTAPFHPGHARDMSSSAPDPYLTFERAWGQSLDGLVDGLGAREPARRAAARKSHTEPILLDPARPVHRSATVRSADAADHPGRAPRPGRPRSAGGPPEMWCASPTADDRAYGPPSRRASHAFLHPPPPHDPPRLFRYPSPGPPRRPSIPAPRPADAPRHHRPRAATLVPEYPPGPSGPKQNGLGSAFKEVIIRFERQHDGSTSLSREVKSRTVDLDGTVHDRYRRQRAAAVI